MAHQAEIEKTNYRNWVRGGLAYKYLKQGIEGFADDLVLQEHIRILQDINHTPGLTCNQCSVGSFRPKHTRTGMVTCSRGLTNCCCLNRKKKPCPNNVCDAIMEEILDCHDSHRSKPPTPYWRNCYIQKWCSDPWEVAKCFIHSPGYSDKAKASDIDAAGLLHVFINNISLHSHLSCKISGNGTDIFSKTLRRRNAIYHSNTMELEDNDLNECIDDIIAILEDEKELKQRPDAQQAVEKLHQLQLGSFIITTNNEVDVCRDAMAFITDRSEELKQMIQDAKDDIDKKKTEVSEAVDDKTQEALDGALKKLENQNDSKLQAMEKAINLLREQLMNAGTVNSAIKQRLTQIENSVVMLDTTKCIYEKRLAYKNQTQALKSSLVERYEKDYYKTWISPLKTQANDIDVNEIYVTPNMVIEKKTNGTASTSTLYTRQTQNDTSENRNSSHIESQFKDIDRYRDIFQTDGVRKKKIYIIGDVGTGKSTLSKMMIYNWCRAIRGDSEHAVSTSDTHNTSQAIHHERIQISNIQEMSKFDFLFTIPLQRMSGFSYNIKEMIKTLYKDVMTDGLLDELFDQESERCLIIADGLDEWTPPKHAPSPQHVSYGIPVADGVKNSTLVTLSRPSARGILNMKLSEYDQKIKLKGVRKVSLYDFIEKYMRKLQNFGETGAFMTKIHQIKLKHLEKTPLILQQLIWMFCTGIDTGKSLGDIYSNIVNIMLGWSNQKGELQDVKQSAISSGHTDREFQQMKLPEALGRFPRCEENQRILLFLGKLAFKALTENLISTFGRSDLYRCELSRGDIDTFISCGILVEYNCFNPTVESTQLSFIHISYLEFFAAVYISSHYSEEHLTHEQKPKLASRMALKGLFMKYKSSEDILQLSNLLMMVCGLSPFLLKEISSLISENMISDESMINYRNNNLQKSYCRTHFLKDEPSWQIHRLIEDCLKECRTDDQPVVSLCDVISASLSEPVLQNIVSSSVLSVYLRVNLLCHIENIQWIGTLHQLQFVRIDSIRSCITCGQLSSSFTETVLLKSLTLNKITCDSLTCKGHSIDLSRLNRLQRIHLEDCTVMISSVIKPESLEIVYISGIYDTITHTMCEHLSSSLLQAVSLKHLTLKDITCDLDDCGDHTIDLPKHDQLQSIDIHHCSLLLGSVVNTKRLEKVSISGSYSHGTPHAMCGCLSTSISQAVFLKHLTLKDIICDLDDCGGHAIDLPKHDQLQSIEIHHCSFLLGSVVNTKCLERVSISGSYSRDTSHTLCGYLSASISQVVFLKQLTLKYIVCASDNCGGHFIDLPKHNQLQRIEIDHCSCMLGSVVKTTRLERVYIMGSYGRIEPHGMCEHLSSSLSQAVSFKQLTLKAFICKSIDIQDCSFLFGSVVNTKRLERVSILRSKGRNTPHNIYEYLLASLSQAVSLKQLTLKSIICDSDNCGGHAIDLPKHDQLQSIEIQDCSCLLGSVVNAKRLQRVSLLGNYGRSTPHGMYEHLSASLSQAVAIKQLTLKAFICDRDNCDGYLIDLPKHDQLQSIGIHHCSCLLDSRVITNRLERVSISGSYGRSTQHAMCEHLSSSLSKVVSIKQLTLKYIVCDRDDCGGHAIDLTKHDQLQSIEIKDCLCLLGSFVSNKSLEIISISGSYSRSTPHEMCDHLSTSLSQAVSVKQLTLKNIACDKEECGGHAIDLPKHDRLQSIDIHHCSSVLGSVVNTKRLERVFISGIYGRSTPHAMCEHLSSSLSEVASLKQLTLKEIICDRDNCGVHLIDLPKRDQLKTFEIHHCSFLLGSVVNTTRLERVSISGSYGRNKPDGMCEHLSSSLSDVSSLKRLTLTNIICDRDDCGSHAIDLPQHGQLRSIEIHYCSCLFGSVVNTKRLEVVSILGSKGRRTPHKMCKYLSSSLSQAVSLKQLTLKDIICDRDDCEGHTIDLPKHDQLQNI